MTHHLIDTEELEDLDFYESADDDLFHYEWIEKFEKKTYLAQGGEVIDEGAIDEGDGWVIEFFLVKIPQEKWEKILIKKEALEMGFKREFIEQKFYYKTISSSSLSEFIEEKWELISQDSPIKGMCTIRILREILDKQICEDWKKTRPSFASFLEDVRCLKA